jgi:cytochrome c
MKRLALLPLLAAVSVTAAQAQDAQVAAGKAAFASICALCHTAEKGHNNIGPSLYGVVGRKAGTAPGFSYSKAMLASGITWDPDTIDVFITAPKARVPGTKMPYAGLKDATKRQAIIAYLKTLHD